MAHIWIPWWIRRGFKLLERTFFGITLFFLSHGADRWGMNSDVFIVNDRREHGTRVRFDSILALTLLGIFGGSLVAFRVNIAFVFCKIIDHNWWRRLTATFSHLLADITIVGSWFDKDLQFWLLVIMDWELEVFLGLLTISPLVLSIATFCRRKSAISVNGTRFSRWFLNLDIAFNTNYVTTLGLFHLVLTFYLHLFRRLGTLLLLDLVWVFLFNLRIS